MKLVHLLPLLVIACGCHQAAPGYTPVPPPPVEPVSTKDVHHSTDLMPLDEGNQWVFTLRLQSTLGAKVIGGGEQTVTYRVESVLPNGDATMVLAQDDKVLDRQTWRSNGDGLFQVSGGLKNTQYVPPQPIARLPLDTGNTFQWKGRGIMADGSISNAHAESKVLPSENVDTGIGPLSAIPVVSLTTFGNSKSENTSWFHPGIGLVRLRTETVDQGGRHDILILTLNNYALKRSQ